MPTLQSLSPLPVIVDKIVAREREEAEVKAERELDGDSEAPTLEDLSTFETYLNKLQSSISSDLPSTINAAKFSRILTEKYGFLKPLLTHPTISSYIKQFQRAYYTTSFSPLGDPKMSPGGIIMFLAMLNRFNLPLNMLILIVAFLLSVKPWALIALLTFTRFVENYRLKSYTGATDDTNPGNSRMAKIENSKVFTESSNNQIPPVGTPLTSSTSPSTSSFDVIVIGTGLTSLYTSSLLSKQNLRVLLLSESSCSINSITHDNVVFDNEDFTGKKLFAVEKYVSAGTCTIDDSQGGVRFYRVGNKSNGYAYEVIQCGEEEPFVVRSGGRNVLEDFEEILMDGFGGDGSLESYLKACEVVKKDAGKFFNRKILDENTLSLLDSVGGPAGKGAFHEASVRYSQDLFKSLIPKSASPVVRAHIAGIGFKAENITPSSCSMGVHIVEASNRDGAWKPVGGSRVLGTAMENVIKEAGGEVYNLGDKKIERLTFETTSSSDAGTHPVCTGVKTSDGKTYTAKTAVISALPLQHTLMNLIDSSLRSKNPVENLELLKERRPLLKLYLTFSKSSEELNLPSADFYRLPGASLPVDEVKVDEHGNRMGVNHGNIGAHAHTFSKFTPGSSWTHVSFPSASDPSWDTLNDPSTSCCVVTVEADDDFVIPPEAGEATLSYKINSTSTTAETQANMKRKILEDLNTLFPTITSDVIKSSNLSEPLRKGLTHNCMRYAAKCVKPSTPYPNLFLGSEDLTFDSFSGRLAAGAMAANAVLGYDAFDLMYLGKNVVEDLRNNVGGGTPETKGEGEEAVKLMSKSKAEEAKKND